jgi:glycosyltransferase involved in cell wall biosynthesis
VREALARSHVFLLPSIAEALPLCLMEALGAGLAVVATDVGSVDQIVIDGRTGLIVPPRNVDAIADRLTLLADVPGHAADLGRAGRDHVLRVFDHNRAIDSLVSLYRRLIADEPTGAYTEVLRLEA